MRPVCLRSTGLCMLRSSRCEASRAETPCFRDTRTLRLIRRALGAHIDAGARHGGDDSAQSAARLAVQRHVGLCICGLTMTCARVGTLRRSRREASRNAACRTLRHPSWALGAHIDAGARHGGDDSAKSAARLAVQRHVGLCICGLALTCALFASGALARKHRRRLDDDEHTCGRPGLTLAG